MGSSGPDGRWTAQSNQHVQLSGKVHGGAPAVTRASVKWCALEVQLLNLTWQCASRC